jgi:ubiquinone/menaquinone biosynthesis C-methylase UbiE
MKGQLKEQWDSRYSSDEYIYGEEPNTYFKSVIDTLKPGKILLPGEGEGRNAVYAASNGWSVTAFDISTEARKKALALAKKMKVEIEYITGSFDEMVFADHHFDCIAMIFVHMHYAERSEYTGRIIRYLKPGGSLIMEAFSKKQILNSSGGPKDENMLFTTDMMKQDFATLGILELCDAELVLNEGTFHRGKADVIRFHGVAPIKSN